MKKEPYNLINQDIANRFITRFRLLPVDGTYKVVISDIGSKSSRQHGLYWMWSTEVSEAGIGGKHEDTKNGVHLVAKYRWLVPILMRDDPFFADIYLTWKENWGQDEERMLWFIDKQTSTKDLTVSQMAELLTDFERHYRPLVNLTNPDLYGLSDEK